MNLKLYRVRERSAYIFGFAIGAFNATTQKHKHTRFEYLSAKHQREELLQTFAETANMLDFFEEKSGIPYPWVYKK